MLLLYLPIWGSGGHRPHDGFRDNSGHAGLCERSIWNRSLEGRSVSVQGLGVVGYHVAKQLSELKVKLVVCDINTGKVRKVVEEFGVRVVLPEEIYNQDVEIYSPCALGATINDETLKKLRCKIICGCANNQLKEERDADPLQKMGIPYAPDYIANARGTI